MNAKSDRDYLNQYQLIPYDRTIQFFSDVFNHSFSQGTIFNVAQDCYNKLENITEMIKMRVPSEAKIIKLANPTQVKINYPPETDLHILGGNK